MKTDLANVDETCRQFLEVCDNLPEVQEALQSMTAEERVAFYKGFAGASFTSVDEEIYGGDPRQLYLFVLSYLEHTAREALKSVGVEEGVMDERVRREEGED